MPALSRPKTEAFTLRVPWPATGVRRPSPRTTDLPLTGSIVSETVFSYPGVGQLLIDAVRKRDFPQLQAAVLFLSFLYVLINLGVDMLYGYLDPRVRT